VRLLATQYRAHPSWTAKPHADNLAVLAAEHGLDALLSDSTVRRYLRAQGLERMPRARSPARRLYSTALGPSRFG